MKQIMKYIGIATVVLTAAAMISGCASDPNKTTVRVMQGAGSGRKVGIVQDPVTGQYSLGYQSIIAAALIDPITSYRDTNGTVQYIVPDAVMSYEVGAKPYFFGSAQCTITCAVGPNAVASMLGGSHIPVNSPYWQYSATGLATNLPVIGNPTGILQSLNIQTFTDTNGVTRSITNLTQTPLIIKP